MEAVAATVPGCEAGKCSVPGVPGTGPDFGDFSESISPAAVWSDIPEDDTGSMHARVECGWPGGLLGGSRPGWRIPRVGAPRRRSKVM